MTFFFLSACSVDAGVLETEREQDRDAIRKAKALYSSCMNESEALLNWLELVWQIYMAQIKQEHGSILQLLLENRPDKLGFSVHCT